MVTWLLTALASFLANRGIAVAKGAIPYVLYCTPSVMAVLAFLYLWQTGTTLTHVLMAIIVIGEGLMGLQIDGAFDGLFKKS